MLEQVNTSLFLYINQFAGINKSIDAFMILFADKLPILFALVLLWLWFFNKNGNLTQRKNRQQSALFAGYVMLLGLAINLSITAFYFHPRPFMDHLGTLLIPHVPETSFPSDHTTLMVSVSLGLMLFVVTQKLGRFLLLLGVLGGLSRVYCGIHYPLDILGSIIASSVSALVVFKLKTSVMRLNDYIIGWYDAFISGIHTPSR
jgi:undecaprenyl-diphosphatase